MRLNLYYTTLSLLAYSVTALRLETQMRNHAHDFEDYECGGDSSEFNRKTKCDNMLQDLAKLTRKMELELKNSSEKQCLPLNMLKKTCDKHLGASHSPSHSPTTVSAALNKKKDQEASSSSASSEGKTTADAKNKKDAEPKTAPH